MHVDELMTLERYSHVMHLTSQVSGELRDGLGPIDVLRATLPAGTVSGAPKVRAMEIIDELEPVKRGPYAGVVGYVDWSGNLDTAIAIRTMFCAPDGRQPAGRRRHRRRLRPRRRGPRVPQQGGRAARRDPRRPPDDRRPPRRRHPRLTAADRHSVRGSGGPRRDGIDEDPDESFGTIIAQAREPDRTSAGGAIGADRPQDTATRTVEPPDEPRARVDTARRPRTPARGALATGWPS